MQKINNVNALKLELYEKPQIITNMNQDVKKELQQRIKETFDEINISQCVRAKNIILSLCHSNFVSRILYLWYK